MADIIYWCIYPDGSTPDPTASEIVGETYASAMAYGNDTGPGVTTTDFIGAAIAGSYSGDYRIAAVWSDGTNYSNVAISGVVSVGGEIIEAGLTISTYSGMTPAKNAIIEGSINFGINQFLESFAQADINGTVLLTQQVGLQTVVQAVMNAGLTLSSISNITVNGSVLSLEVTLPCGRTLLVSIENRILQIQADNRTISINGCN